MLLKQHRGDRDQLLTKFKGLLVCRRTRDCEEFELADFFEGQSDTTPVIHCITFTTADRDPVNIREKLSEFLLNSFETRCKAIMCRKKVKNGKIRVVPGRFTIVAFNRNTTNNAKEMHKVIVSDCNRDIDAITQEPVVVLSHVGTINSGHYVIYSKVGDRWYLNDDRKRIQPVNVSPLEQSTRAGETVNIVVFENNI